MALDRATDDVIVIDAHYLSPRRMSIYLIIDNGKAVFVDNNTVHAVPRMLEALSETGLTPDDVEYVIVTHVHLDHAGGTAELLSRCPNATALVHPKTRRHLASPTRLVEASRQVYGDQFDAIYGDIQPVPDDRMHSVADGEKLQWQGRTLTFFHTLGHATHHYCVHDDHDDSVFTGDSFGIAYAELQHGHRPYLFVAATPTEFDPADARKAVDQILAFQPKRVCLGHYGCYENVDEMAERLLFTIGQCEELINEAAGKELDDDALRTWLHDRTRIITEEALKQSGVPADDETMKWVNPDIMLNAQGIFAAVKRKRRKQDREA